MQYVKKLDQYPREFSDSFRKTIENTKALFRKYEEYIKKPIIKCCVVGNVSAGKSTLINALLGKHILHEGTPVGTLCAAICQSSSNDEEYFKIFKGNDCLNEHMPIDKVGEINDKNREYSNISMDSNNYLDIYLNVLKYKILDKIMLIDCPGFNDDNFNAISKYCKYADIMVFCFRARAGITDLDIYKINKIKEKIGNFQISFIINYFHPDELTNKNAIIYRLSPLLTNEHAIYFISAKEEEERMIISLKRNLNDTRGGEFELFKNGLENQKSLATISYRRVYLDLICSVNELLNYLNCDNFQNYQFADEIFVEMQQEIIQLINNDKTKYYKIDSNKAMMEYSNHANKLISKHIVKQFFQDYRLNEGIINENYFYKRFFKDDNIKKPTFQWFNFGVKNEEMKSSFLDYFHNNSTTIQKEIMKHYIKETETCIKDIKIYEEELRNITNGINELNEGFP